MDCSLKIILHTIVRMILSNLGVLILIMLYLVGGGWLFIYLEAENEIKSCSNSMEIYYNKLNETTTRAVMISQAGYNTSYLLVQVIGMLSDFAGNVFSLSVSPTQNCTTLGSSSNMQQWNLANSMFFCATLVTTIGYGQIAPVTMWGRITCIVYSFIGIPLMVIFLSNFGVVLANIFRFVYFNLCCCRCFIRRQKEPEIEITEEDMKSQANFLSIEGEKSDENCGPAKMTSEIEQDAEDDEVITIPIIIITSFLAFYMFLGAVLFRIWEPWDFVAGMYFAFITVSTIGLGDLYPTKNRAMNNDATVELLAAAVYCLIGLAVLSMCLSLIQEEISAKLNWFGRLIGLTSSEDDNLDELTRDETDDHDNKPVIIAHPLIVGMDYSNDAYDDTIEEDDVQDYTKHSRVALYPKLY